MKQMISASLSFLLVLLACAGSADTSAGDETGAFTVFLVRHAEKDPWDDDPALSGKGVMRSKALATMLGDAGVEAIWSTDYKRTRQTAQPLADALELRISIYNPAELKSLATDITQTKQNALVIGHSNTTPELARLLGGDDHGEMDEKSEYDRLYILIITGGEVVSTTLLRYSAGSIVDFQSRK